MPFFFVLPRRGNREDAIVGMTMHYNVLHTSVDNIMSGEVEFESFEEIRSGENACTSCTKITRGYDLFRCCIFYRPF